MAYVESFTWDIFLSYAHADNMPYPPTLPRGWVTEFQEVLSKVLLEKVGGKVSIFSDQVMSRNEEFNPAINAAINGSALFIALLSRSYLRSQACSAEVDAFCKLINDESQKRSLGTHSRFFNVLRYNIPPEQWLKPLQGKNSYELFQASSNGSLGRPLSIDPLADQFQLLADEICKVLDSLKNTKLALTTSTALSPKPSQRFSVFVADVDDELVSNRNELIDTLLDRRTGEIDVLGSAHAREEIARENIAKSQVSIHILGDTPNPVVENQLQLGKGAPYQIIWLSKNVDIPRDHRSEYQERLLKLQFHMGHANSYEFIPGDDSTADIVAAVQRTQVGWLQRYGAHDLYLDIRKSDWQGARQLRDYLKKELAKQQIRLLYPYYDPQDPGQDDFDQKVMHAKAVVLFYGAIDEEVVKQRLAALNELTQHPVISVYAARPVPPEKKPDNIKAMMPQVKWIDNTTAFNPADLEELLDIFRSGRSQAATN